ncbi:MAG TPA: hypothetical protein DC001_03975, partial [Clostridiales bacterium]|nr:hypothetical protein [Clostridiales bacterium]
MGKKGYKAGSSPAQKISPAQTRYKKDILFQAVCENNKNGTFVSKMPSLFGAGDRDRTGKGFPPRDFKSL